LGGLILGALPDFKFGGEISTTGVVVEKSFGVFDGFMNKKMYYIIILYYIILVTNSLFVKTPFIGVFK
jgi:hypothetical protein